MGLGLRHDYGNQRGGISKRDPRGDSDYVSTLSYVSLFMSFQEIQSVLFTVLSGLPQSGLCHTILRRRLLASMMSLSRLEVAQDGLPLSD